MSGSTGGMEWGTIGGQTPERAHPSESLTSPDSGGPERAAEAALRPRRLGEFIGQKVVREQLSLP